MTTAQVLDIIPPNEIRFHGPFDKVVTSMLQLRNPSKDRICFKVKTTAPKRYCVRPNSGVIEAGKTVEVAVMLQPFTYDPNDKSRHKFMVQSLVVTSDGPVDSLESIWKESSPDKYMDSKLRVVLDPEPGNDTTAKSAASSGVANSDGAKFDGAKGGGEYSTATGGEREAREVQQLKNELRSLKMENERLSEQEVRLRKLALRDSTAQPIDKSGPQAVATTTAFPPALFLILALLIGLLIGKFVL